MTYVRTLCYPSLGSWLVTLILTILVLRSIMLGSFQLTTWFITSWLFRTIRGWSLCRFIWWLITWLLSKPYFIILINGNHSWFPKVIRLEERRKLLPPRVITPIWVTTPLITTMPMLSLIINLKKIVMRKSSAMNGLPSVMTWSLAEKINYSLSSVHSSCHGCQYKKS